MPRTYEEAAAAHNRYRSASRRQPNGVSFEPLPLGPRWLVELAATQEEKARNQLAAANPPIESEQASEPESAPRTPRGLGRGRRSSAKPRTEERLSETVKLRITPSELKDWAAHAARCGLSLSELIRRAVGEDITYDKALRHEGRRP